MKPFTLLATAQEWVIDNAAGPTSVLVIGCDFNFGDLNYQELEAITIGHEYGTWDYA